MPKSLKDLSGKWTMNRDLSSDVTETLKIQGFGLVMRKAAAVAPVTLDVEQTENEIRIKQSTVRWLLELGRSGQRAHTCRIQGTSAISIPAVQEMWTLDWEMREQDDAFLGKVRSKSRWTTVAKVKEAYSGYLTEGLSGDSDDSELIESYVESVESDGWKATQIWTMEGEQFVRRVVTSKGEKVSETKLVYDFKG